jgi:DNA-binding MarR family transcriptional regulator
MAELVIRGNEDLRILKAIDRDDYLGKGASPALIRKELGMHRSTFMRVLAIYEENGLIERKQCTIDPRSKKIFITTRGKETISIWAKWAAKIEEDMKKLGFGK